MYAIFEDGSRQYKVSEGDVVRVDYREAEVGARLEFNRVLLYAGGEERHIGQPTVAGARVLAEVVDHPTIKTYIQHFRGGKNYGRFRAHRHPFWPVQVRNILLAEQEPPAPPPAPAPVPEQPATT